MIPFCHLSGIPGLNPDGYVGDHCEIQHELGTSLGSLPTTPVGELLPFGLQVPASPSPAFNPGPGSSKCPACGWQYCISISEGADVVKEETKINKSTQISAPDG